MAKQTSKSEYVYKTVEQDPLGSLKKKEAFEEDEVVEFTGPFFGARHCQVFLYFLLGFTAFAFRVSLSVGIVAMTDPSINSNPDIPTYPHWKNKNIILSSFFMGYIIPQVFAAYVAKRYGAKWFLISTMFLQSILSILTPWTAAKFGANGIMISRAIQGLCQGFVFPSCAHFLSQWSPPQERSRFGSIVYSSGKCGTVASMLITGLISSSWYGWPAAFYFFGGLGFLWCLMMIIFGYDTPQKHPKISDSERIFIEKSLGASKTANGQHHRTPWGKIFMSVPVWALFAVQSGNNYCFWTLLTQIPTYMNYVMGFDMKHNSFWSAIPYFTFWILSFIFGYTADSLINKKIVTRSTTRKLSNSIGLLIPATALIILGFTKSEQTVQALVLLIIAVGFNSACLSGFGVNHMDLSPNHAGILMGLLNGTSQISAVIAPLVVQFLVNNERDQLQWRYVFFVAAGTSILTSTIYNIFGSGKTQSWNIERDDNEEAG